LSAGSVGQTFSFTLSADQKTSDSKPRQTGTFTIKTSPNNQTSGALTYTATIDPSLQFTTSGSPAAVKVILVP